MIDDTAGTGGSNVAPESGQTGTGERVAFCQQCGKGLTADTVRRAGSAVYCEPCLVARLESPNPAAAGPAATGPGPSAPGWTPVNATTQPTGAPGQPAAAPVLTGNEPSPWLAALLGLIPGVGAMYNGQYAKGLAHLVIFAVLDALSNDVHGVSGLFGLLVLAWVVYQSVDAYHTAKARRDGTPLPNPFGLNDIGDRMGFGRNWPGSAARPVTAATTAGWATAGATAGSSAPRPPQGPHWSGYVPPTNFGATATPPPPPPSNPYASDSNWTSGSNWAQVPYASTYTGDPYHAPSGAPVPPPPPMPPLPSRRFPIGAAWLIAVGLIFLLANLNGSWRLGGSWAVAIVLAALGTFILFRRVEMVRAWEQAAPDHDADDYGMTSRLVCQVRWPVMLLVLALLFALQAAGIRTLGQTWGILLIAFGALLILERTLGRTPWYPPTAPGATTAPPPNAVRPGSMGPGFSGKDGQ